MTEEANPIEKSRLFSMKLIRQALLNPRMPQIPQRIGQIYYLLYTK